MNNNLFPIHFCTLILCLSIAACSPISSETKTNSVAEPITKQTPVTRVERVVALTSLTADIIYRLDETKLVGISGSRLVKQDPRFTNLPKVSQGNTPPNLEKIVALKPDLVIGAEGFSDRTLNRLEELGIKTISTKVDSWSALEQVTKTLAKAISAEPQSLLQQYQTYLPKDDKSGASTLVLVSRQPILSPNKNSWAGDLLKQFKVQNLAGDLQGGSQFGGYVTLSAEKVLQANPEIILLVDPGQEGLAEQLKTEPFWQELKASQSHNVYVFDYYGLVNPGSLAKIQEVCQQLARIFSN